MTAYLKDDAAGETFISDATSAVYDYFRVLAGSAGYGRKME
jgi:hypothetical protein